LVPSNFGNCLIWTLFIKLEFILSEWLDVMVNGIETFFLVRMPAGNGDKISRYDPCGVFAAAFARKGKTVP